MVLPRSPRLVALLGDPVAHSRSPALHNAAFRALGLDLVYVACRVAPADLPEAVAGLRALGAVGANVTVPHKEAVVRLIDRLTPVAEAVSAVNTLVLEDGGTLRGENTDVAGFLAPLTPHLEALRSSEVVVLGAGGAARAVVYAALTALDPARVTIAARRPAQAERLAADLAPFDPRRALRVRPLAEAGGAMRAAHLVVNATPVGLLDDGSPSPESDAFHRGQVVYDLVYGAVPTRLLRDAAARGATTLDGRDMLRAQAAASFLLWTGHEMPPANGEETRA
ncbi:MAG TPA: shikimate dehydrogenase [Rubricoccaceae bacterium]|nr:shikimate dehydrogenase [Rubricoccaceae bacterium]